MSLSPECAQQQDREAANVKKILVLAAVGSLGIHGLACAITTLLPRQVTAQETPPIELLLVSEPEEASPKLAEPLAVETPVAIPEPTPEDFELSDSSRESSSDVLMVAAKLAPGAPKAPEPASSAMPESNALPSPKLDLDD